MALQLSNLKFILLILCSSFLISISSCSANKSAVDKRKHKLEKKKRRNPDDCPKLDC